MWRLLRTLILILPVLLSTGCATAQTGEQEHNPDPFEPFNRAMFTFNEGVDRVVLGPAARGYQAITPAFMERGIRNFFANLYDINGAFNAVLQGRFPEAARDSGRFVVNTTVGMLGFISMVRMTVGIFCLWAMLIFHEKC